VEVNGKCNYPHLREAQRLIWRPSCTLSHGARHIAAYLLNRMNESYEGARPTVDQIAAETGIERRSVIRYTKEVIDSAILTREPGRKGMYIYRLTDVEQIVSAIDGKLGQWADKFWAAKREQIQADQQ
jgi:predicted transcriptional regulator